MKHRWLEVMVNGLFWAGTGWLIINSLSVTGQEVVVDNGVETVTYLRDDTLYQELILLVGISLVGFYAHLLNILSHPRKTNPRWTVIWGLLILMAPGLIKEVVFLVGPAPAIRIPLMFEYGIYLFYFSCATGYGVIKLLIRSEQSKKTLLLDKKKTELSLLKSQLQPHFLFNALNNLLSMVDQHRDAPLAKALDQLSELLRYVVYDTQQEKVPLHKEIAFIQTYAEVHQLRFDEQEVNFQLEIRGDHLNQTIEPGIFIPFVENAFKYGVMPETHSIIHVTIDACIDGNINFSCSNPVYETLLRKEGKGAGLENVQERLKLTYPAKFHLDITQNEKFDVQLELKTS